MLALNEQNILECLLLEGFYDSLISAVKEPALGIPRILKMLAKDKFSIQKKKKVFKMLTKCKSYKTFYILVKCCGKIS